MKKTVTRLCAGPFSGGGEEKRSRGETNNDVLTAGPQLQLEHALNKY